MKAFQWIMALFSRLFPGRASDLALQMMTGPRLPLAWRGRAEFAPDRQLPVGERARLNIWAGGPKRVLLVHGWSGHWTQFETMMKVLGRDDFSFYALQMPGHGSEADGGSHVGEFIATLRQALDVIGEPVEVLIGHSMGASAAAYVLSERGDIARAVLIAAPTDFRGVVGRMAVMLKLGGRARKQLQDKMAARVGISYDALDMARRGDRIDARLLLVHDSDDREVPFTDSLRLYRSVAAATLHQTLGKGHRRVLSDKDVLEQVAGFAREGVLSVSVADAGQLRVPA